MLPLCVSSLLEWSDVFSLHKDRGKTKAESVLRRIIGEQRRKARDTIAARVAEELPLEVGETLDKLLEVEAGETVSGLPGIKKNPAKPSAVALRRLAERLDVDRGDRSARHGPGMAQQELSAISFSIRPQLFRSPRLRARVR